MKYFKTRAVNLYRDIPQSMNALYIKILNISMGYFDSTKDWRIQQCLFYDAANITQSLSIIHA